MDDLLLAQKVEAMIQYADSWRVREQLLAPVLFGATS